MDTFVPSHPASPTLRLRIWFLALAVGLAAILLPASGALADLESQEKIDEAVAEYTEATTQARDNIPGNAGVKRAEDALDAAARAKMDAEDKLEAAKKDANPTNAKRAQEAVATAEAAETAAQTAADDARKSAKETDTEKERADKYREALANRRAARRTMLALLPELKQLVGTRRHNLVDVKEVEDAMRFLRTRIGRSEKPITIQSVAALIPFWPMTANVATDSQALCTFGKATPTSVAFEPSDGDGNPLKEKLDTALGRALTALLAAPPGGGAAPINISNPDPDNAAKQNKQEKAGAGPQAPGAGPADPKTTEKREATPAPAAGPPTSADLLGGSILDQIDESKTASPPAAATASRPPAQPAPSTGPKRPADTGLGLMGTKLQNGEAPEEAIDRFSKLADEARARGDRLGFELYQGAAQSVARWVQNRIAESLPPLQEMLQRAWDAPKTPSDAAKRAQLGGAVNLFKEWARYEGKLSTWQFEGPPQAPEAAAGTPSGTPAPTSEEPKPAPARSAAPGEKSAPAPDKSSEKADTPAKTPTPGADPGNISTGQVTIIFKVEERVLQGGSQIEEYKPQMVKLTAPEPALPKTGQTKTAKAKLDTGHDRSPVTCNSGAEGRCKAQIPTDERESYGWPALLPAAGFQDKTAAGADNDPLLEFVEAHSAIQASQNYSVELPLAKNTGMVVQKAPAKPASALLAALADVPPGVQVQKSDFKIGDKTYTRVGFTGPDAITAAAARKFADRLGKDAQIDQCGEKAPGPPLGMTPVSFSALNNELPLATLDLRRSTGSGEAKR